MKYSMTIAGYDIWNQWHMIPTERPVVAPPRLKTNYIDLTGINGSLDYTETLNGLLYSNREGSWEFYVIIDHRVSQEEKFSTKKTWTEIYNDFLEKVHGKKVRLILTEDPYHFYQGRVEITGVKNEEAWLTVTIEYVLEPNTYDISPSSINSDFWNIQSNKIFYKGNIMFNSSGTTAQLVNDTGSSQSLRVNSATPVKVTNTNTNDSAVVYPNHDPDSTIMTVPTGTTEYEFKYPDGDISGDRLAVVDYTPTGSIF